MSGKTKQIQWCFCVLFCLTLLCLDIFCLTDLLHIYLVFYFLFSGSSWVLWCYGICVCACMCFYLPFTCVKLISPLKNIRKKKKSTQSLQSLSEAFAYNSLIFLIVLMFSRSLSIRVLRKHALLLFRTHSFITRILNTFPSQKSCGAPALLH